MGAIVRAIRNAGAMVLLFSTNANNSDEIKKELALASQQRLMVIPVRMDDVIPSEDFAFELATRQWINLFDDWEESLDRLARQIDIVVPREYVPPAPPPSEPGPKRTQPSKAVTEISVQPLVTPQPLGVREPLRRNFTTLLVSGGAGLLLLASIGWFIAFGRTEVRPKDAPLPSKPVAQAVTPKAGTLAIIEPAKSAPQPEAVPSAASVDNPTRPLPEKTFKKEVMPPAKTHVAKASSAPPARALLSSQVQQAVDTARAFEKQALDKAAKARLAQDRALPIEEQAKNVAQEAERGAPGYGTIPMVNGLKNWAGQISENGRAGMGVLTFEGGEKEFAECGIEKCLGPVFVKSFPNGDRYAGEAAAGYYNGVGVFQSHDGWRYEGEFDKGAQSGVAVTFFGPSAGNLEYRGQIFGDHHESYGVWVMPDKSTHVGHFTFDGQDSYGARYDARGKLLEQGLYQNDVLKTPMMAN